MVGVRSEAPDEEETVAPAVAVAEVAVPVEPPVSRVVQEEEEPRSAMAEAFRVSGMTDASEDVAEEEQTSAEVHAVADDATSVTPPTDTVSDEPAAADEEAAAPAEEAVAEDAATHVEDTTVEDATEEERSADQ